MGIMCSEANRIDVWTFDLSEGGSICDLKSWCNFVPTNFSTK